jgi:hypothetical protein
MAPWPASAPMLPAQPRSPRHRIKRSPAVKSSRRSWPSRPPPPRTHFPPGNAPDQGRKSPPHRDHPRRVDAIPNGLHTNAAVLLGSAQHARDASSPPLIEPSKPQHARSVKLATDGLGQTASEVAFQRGRAMTMDESAAFAVEGKQPPNPPAKAVPHTVHTRRQWQIARLAADGLSNTPIAGQAVYIRAHGRDPPHQRLQQAGPGLQDPAQPLDGWCNRAGIDRH